MNEVKDKRILALLNGTAEESEPSENEVTDPALLAILNKENTGPPPTQQATPTETAPTTDSRFLDSLIGAGEAGMSVLTGAAAEPLSGLSGIAGTLLSGRGVEGGVDTVSSTAETLTYQPRSETGQRYLQNVGETLAPVGEFFTAFNETLGDFAYDTTGSPTAAAAAYSLPTLAASLLGFKGKRVAEASTPAAIQLRNAQKTMLQDDVFKYSGDVADVKLNSKGDVVPDRIGEELLDLGFSKNSTAVITNSNPATKARMSNMLETFDRTSTNDVLKLSEKMSTEVGDSVRVRLAALNNRRKNLGSRLDSVVENMDSSIQIDEPLSGFFADLTKDFGIQTVIKTDGTIAIKGIPKSPLATSSLSQARSLIKDTIKVINQKSKNGVISGRDAHKLKKLLDEMVDSQKAANAGISNRTHGRLLSLRQGINEALGEASPEYAKINGDLAETITSMSPFNSFIKGSKSWDDANISEVVGAAVKNLGSDSASAAALRQNIAQMEVAVKKAGYNFSDDPRALLAFKDTIDNYFRLDAEALAKQAGKYDTAISSGLLDAGASMAVGNKFGLVHDIAKLRQLGVSKKKAESLIKEKLKAKEALKKALKN